ncbi:uncharacterized protein LOC135383715 [Ornithodoros turicata]|uniref:uncharacterized protein LOC135383715 n=1 Tax=Ornithodoros turicata TaxID=34597 RepID=UPI003139F033
MGSTSGCWQCLLLAWMMFTVTCDRGGATLCNQLTMLGEECQCEVGPHDRLILRCVATHANTLYSDLERVTESNIPLYEMQVRDSDLEELKKEFPAHINEHMETLTLDNTKIGQVYIGNILRPMRNLRRVRLDNETVQQIDREMFENLVHLEEVGVNGANLVTVKENAFMSLNLTLLTLRHNHLTQIPSAVTKLPYLVELDLFENPIEVVNDQEALVLQSTLKHIERLVMNKIQCDCTLGKGEFLNWVRRRGISGVTCGEPSSLLGRDITKLTTKQICNSSATSSLAGRLLFVTLLLHFSRHFTS